MNSPLYKKRLDYTPIIPDLLQDLNEVSFQQEKQKTKPLEELRPFFPKTLDQAPYVLEKKQKEASKPLIAGILFSGGPAAGGHNVVWALLEGLKKIHTKSRLVGFLGGIEGVLEGKTLELSLEKLASFRNQGGFDLMGTGRGKLDTREQMEKALHVCKRLSLDTLVIIGGDDSNTNGALLAEYFLEKEISCKVIGIPKTIDGDVRSKDIEISFGFDSACKTYSEMIGNIARDALSAKKYYHFIKLMGRSASHICLECALATHPNLALIGEERQSLQAIVKKIADLICSRFQAGKEYGVILIPEGILEFIPEMDALIKALSKDKPESLEEPHKALFWGLPENIQKQFLLGKDPHGNIKVSQIDTEELLLEKVKDELKKRGDYKGAFTAQNHFLGYEGRCCFPSNFDANYAYALGLSAAAAIRDELNGVICSLQKLKGPPRYWTVKAVPIVQLVHFEMRKNKKVPVIKKQLVDLQQSSFRKFSSFRESWEIEDVYQYPGPIQFFGDPLLTDLVPILLSD